ncbi:gluconolactonase [Burkholderia sp. WAC0059]|uniref:SMP-30/gluconolactonase/LRE family protein n=1 Tax=Burkholderia sp. WAC0059 TaxID=2066022 RepID=UPI000C7F12A0|nr:SMP-30/gluconolactonase/LRE family protein [Burkholderia sp. WAC0059]PLZ02854.1 gluconolactonase [Burkholderia sp. WAC0059]
MTDVARIDMSVWTRLPDALRRPVVTTWSRANAGGRQVDSFLEGPCFDDAGNLFVVDIPHGRIFRVTPAGEWSVLAEYDGEPNGLALHPDGRLFVADCRRGLLSIDTHSGAVHDVLARRNAEGFKGLNDLTFARSGDLYFTDQGQTGLHDPTGRVFRLRSDGRLDLLISNGPSPNGLVLSPDESVLFVAMTRDNAIWRLPLLPDGSATKVGRFCAFHGTGGPDGLAMDEAGNLFVSHVSLGTVFVVNPDGEVIRRFRSLEGRATSNVAFGGASRDEVFVTESASGSILRFPWATPGIALPGNAARAR